MTAQILIGIMIYVLGAIGTMSLLKDHILGDDPNARIFFAILWPMTLIGVGCNDVLDSLLRLRHGNNSD